MATRKPAYKSYFRQNSETPRIPRRTIFRQIRRTRLLERFKREQIKQAVREVEADHEENPNEQNNVTGIESDDDIESSSDEKEQPTEYRLLFPNGKISTDESIRLVYSFILRHKLSKSAVSDLLILINLHLPKGASIPETAFLVEKAIQPDFGLATRCFYCPQCDSLTEKDKLVCDACATPICHKSALKNGKFFIMFNLKSALSKLIELNDVRNNLSEAFKKRQCRSIESKYEDIMDGRCYKELQLGYFDISCSINTDGVNIFNSSKYIIWPILISINELDYKVRRKHTTLVGLWFGLQKPNFDTFLRPFVLQCNELSDQGLSWIHHGKIIDSKVFFPIVAADSVARCALQGIKQFNGQYGCPWCLNQGTTLHQDERRHKWIYLPVPSPARTKENFIGHLKILQSNFKNKEEKNCFGIKSASQFLLLQKFDIVNGFVFDYMHTCLLGITRTFTNMWFDSKNHEKDFYIGTKIERVSILFQRCKVPIDCNRVTRDLKDMAYWKANEWKTWLFFCIPILTDILKPQYIKHFSKFVNAMTLLTSFSIREIDLNLAETLLTDFCNMSRNLYGDEVCTFNLHILMHATDCVRNWGPLWCYSLFQYEHMNGVLTKYFNGTSQICMQIVRKVVLSQQVRSWGAEGFENEFARSFLLSLQENRKLYLKSFKCDAITFLGCKRKYKFNDTELLKLSKFGFGEVLSGWSFKHFIINGKRFSTEKCNSEKRVNSIIKVNGEIYRLLQAIVIKYDEKDESIIFVKKLTVIPVLGSKVVYKVVRISDCYKIFNLSLIETYKYICSYSDTGNLNYVVEIPNVKEME